jgi:hypothetical protein
MPAPTPPGLRQRLLELHRAGLPPMEIARELSLPDRTVRRLVARARQPDAKDDLPPLPGRPGRPLDPIRLPLRLSCLQLRRENPGWGAGRIRLELQDLYPGQQVPPRAHFSTGCARPAWRPRSRCWSVTRRWAGPASPIRSGRWTPARR